MITDATFEIDGAVFYAPTGGNPEGAAARLSKMIQCSQNVSPATEFDGGVDIEQLAGGLPMAFVRADSAAPCEYRDHNQTSYRYIVYSTSGGLIMTAYVWNWQDIIWETIYSGAVAPFVNAFTNDCMAWLCTMPSGFGLPTGHLLTLRQFVYYNHGGSLPSGLEPVWANVRDRVGCNAAIDQIRYHLEHTTCARGDELSGAAVAGGLLAAE